MNPHLHGGEGQNLGVLIVLERTNLCSFVQSNGKKVQPLNYDKEITGKKCLNVTKGGCSPRNGNDVNGG